MEHDFKNLGISPLSSLDEPKVKVRICKSLSSFDNYLDLFINQLDWLGYESCSDIALILLIFAAGYGKDTEISVAFHCRFLVLGQCRG